MRILALCGSLRTASINAALLRATGRLAPPSVDWRFFDGLGDLPLFNPDLDARPPAPAVALQRELAAADALVIASPEYAHGVTGVIKNALDWLVGFPPFVNVRVAVFNASPRAHHADDALRETLRTMSAVIVEDACLRLPLLGAKLDEAAMVAAPEVAAAIRSALRALASEVPPGGAAARFPVA